MQTKTHVLYNFPVIRFTKKLKAESIISLFQNFQPYLMAFLFLEFAQLSWR